MWKRRLALLYSPQLLTNENYPSGNLTIQQR